MCAEKKNTLDIFNFYLLFFIFSISNWTGKYFIFKSYYLMNDKDQENKRDWIALMKIFRDELF